jgi:hypothetical protein
MRSVLNRINRLRGGSDLPITSLLIWQSFPPYAPGGCILPRDSHYQTSFLAPPSIFPLFLFIVSQLIVENLPTLKILESASGFGLEALDPRAELISV